MNEEQNVVEKKIEVTNVYRRNQAARAKTVVNEGGAGSSKSYSLAQFLIFERLFKMKGWRGLVLRKTRQANKMSTYKVFIDIIKDAGLYVEKNHNKSDLVYSVPELDSYVYFSGMDDREKIKSTEWHDIWEEEANEFDREDFILLKNTRLYRGQLPGGFVPRMWLSYNPVTCWIQGFRGRSDVEFIHSTYKDNPYCNSEYRRTLEALKEEDYAYYKIYALGEVAEAEHIIYKPFEMLELKNYPSQYDEVIYWIDFGFNAPTSFGQIGYRDNKRYLQEYLYKTKLTNGDLIELLQDFIPKERRSRYIYADCAEPNRIQEINNAGFNCIPADKAVKDGIDFCKRQKYVTCAENVNINEERSIYKWKVDKNGNPIDEPVKFKDHSLDGIRYADYTHNKERACESDIVEAVRNFKASPNSISSRQDW